MNNYLLVAIASIFSIIASLLKMYIVFWGHPNQWDKKRKSYAEKMLMLLLLFAVITAIALIA